MQLIPTSDFKYGTYKFENFNYLQSLCYPFHEQDINLIVAAATSSGKTIVGEMQIAYSIAQGQKAIFLSPLKAVTQEKYDDWTDESHYFSKLKVEILTGDYKMTPARLKKLQEADIVLMTSEMLDTRTRYLSNTDNSWLLKVGTIVVDEAHLLTTNRGPALEVGLMRFSMHNPSARITLLSATMSNIEQLQQWLTNMNNKATKAISSDWRPVELEEHYVRHIGADIPKTRIDLATSLLKGLTAPFSGISTFLTSPNTVERQAAQSRINGIKSYNTDKDACKTLVFVHSKSEGDKLCTQLKNIGINALFHNADLDKTARNKLEQNFKKDDLNVLVATSTLAWGINLPARNVIILGNRRGMEEVDDLDIKQMIGRAGRFGMYEKGDAFVICTKGYDMAKAFNVNSKLNKPGTLSFHLIAEIYDGRVSSIDDATIWFKRSLASIQHPSHMMGSWSATLKVNLDKMITENLISFQDGKYKVTPYGKIARDLYLNPFDVAAWVSNFNALAEHGTWSNPSDIAWALVNQTSHYTMDYLPKDLKPLWQTFSASCKFPIKEKNNAFGALMYYRINRANKMYDEGITRHLDALTAPLMQTLARDSGRIFNALKRINELESWHREKDIILLHAQILYGVGEHLLELVSIPGVGETIATQLYLAGIKTLKDVLSNKHQLEKFIPRKASVTKLLKGLEQIESSESEP